MQEQDHLIALATALGIDPPTPASPTNPEHRESTDRRSDHPIQRLCLHETTAANYFSIFKLILNWFLLSNELIVFTALFLPLFSAQIS